MFGVNDLLDYLMPYLQTVLGLRILTVVSLVYGLWAVKTVLRSDKYPKNKMLILLAAYFILIILGYEVQSATVVFSCFVALLFIIYALPKATERQAKYGDDMDEAFQKVAAEKIGADPTLVFYGFRRSMDMFYDFQHDIYVVAESGGNIWFMHISELTYEVHSAKTLPVYNVTATFKNSLFSSRKVVFTSDDYKLVLQIKGEEAVKAERMSVHKIYK